MQVMQGGHKTGKVAEHQCCHGGTWYVMLSEEEMEKTLGNVVNSNYFQNSKKKLRYTHLETVRNNANYFQHRCRLEERLCNYTSTVWWICSLQQCNTSQKVHIHSLLNLLCLNLAKSDQLFLICGSK